MNNETPLNNKEYSLNKFLQCGDLFNILHRSRKIKALQKNAQFFLDTNNYDSYASMLNNGYRATFEQSYHIQKMINKSLDFLVINHNSIENYQQLEYLLSIGIPFTEGNFKKLISCSAHNILLYNEKVFKDFKHTIKIDKVSFPHLTENVHSFLNNKQFLHSLFYSYKKNIESVDLYKDNTSNNISHFFKDKKIIKNSNFSCISSLLNFCPDKLLENVPIQDFIDLFKELQNTDKFTQLNQHQLAILNQVINNYYKNDLHHIFEDTQLIYIKEILPKIRIKENNVDPLDKLPHEAISIINNIENLYSKILKSQQIDIDLQYLDKIFSIHLPVLLKEFLELDPSYRKNLLNFDDKNPEELMISSLHNMSSSFENAFKAINEKTIQNLAIMHKYTQQMK